MELTEILSTRRSIRRYRTTAVEEEKLIAVAEAFRLAPSARNLQDWTLYIVTEKTVKQAIRIACMGEPEMVSKAPALLVACGKPGHVMTCGHRSDSVDLSIAMSFAVLRAWDLGLGTCWMASYYEDKVLEALNLDSTSSIAAISPIGYPDEAPEARPRKPLNEVLIQR